MTPEQWQKARDVLAQALELRPEDRASFLDRTFLPGDPLRGEVERLLSSSEEVQSSFLAPTALHVALTPGTRLSEFEVIALVGAGGMGEVYRARDSRLRRDVAIKVLPASVADDPERLRRFDQEARATAALNHPNILAVFQMGTYEGAPYLVSELLEGNTLRELLVRGPLALRKAVDYAAQVARGLAAAHDKGVVHRDLKPENLFITRDGLAKILDFGLAKLVQRRGSGEVDLPTESRGTNPGVVMGTVGYMAPEQVSGKPADHRADIFAFGAILYEVLTGTRAFRKPTAAETMSAILNEDPPPASQLVATIPPALQKVVRRCLEKNPAERFQSASDLAFALEALSDADVQSASVPPVRRSRSQLTFYVAGALLLVTAATLAFLWTRPRSSIVPPTDWVQITNFADSVSSPALSPDGRLLTFLRGNDTFTTPGQVYVMLLPHANPVRLTNDATAKMSPIFSSDGANIAYTVPWDTWTVPVLGGEPRLWLPNASGLTWADSNNLMFSQITSGNHMELVRSDLSRGHVQPIYNPPSSTGMLHRSYLSPDRKWVIGVEMTGNLWNRCRLIPSDGSTLGVPIGPEDGVCTNAAWSPDGRWMYLNSNSGRSFHIWRQQFPNGRIEQVTSGPTEEEGIAFDPDGRSFITAVGIRRSSVWLHAPSGDRELTSEGSAGLSNPRTGSPFSLDGNTLYYLVRRAPGNEVRADTGVGELWQVDLRSGSTQAVLPGFTVTAFSLSPDGEDIAFSALNPDQTESLWIAPLDRSSSPRMLQSDARLPRFAAGYIYYQKHSPDGSAFAHRIRSDGTGDEQIWPEKIMTLATSPDGRYLAVTISTKGRSEWTLEIVDWARKRIQPVCKDAIGYWSDDGKVFIATGGTGKRDTGAVSYWIDLPTPDALPGLPSAGLHDVSQFGGLQHAHTIQSGLVGIGRKPGTYAFLRESVQRNLYRIPLH